MQESHPAFLNQFATIRQGFSRLGLLKRERCGSLAPTIVRTPCNAGDFPGFYSLVNHACAFSISSLLVWLLDSYPADTETPSDGTPLEEPDVVWLRSGVSGNEQAWQHLFDKWKKPLLAFFYRSLGSMADAEDLTLAVFTRLHRAASRYDRRATFATFLFHIARNLLLNELRRRRRKPAHLLPPESFDYFAEPNHDNTRRVAELEETFQWALEQLPEGQRTLLLLVHQQELDHRTVAATLGVTENAVRVQLHRVRQRLKELMSSTS